MNLNKIFNTLKLPKNYIPYLEQGFIKYGLTTEEDQIRFMANCLNETGGFTRFKENLYYTTPSRLKQVFPSAFSRRYDPNLYIKNPEKLANLVYDDRLFPKGLGNTKDGDGWKYIGRGAIQITGKANYTSLSKDTGIDVYNYPNLLEKDQYKFLSAFWYWKKHKLSEKKSLLSTRQVIAGNYSANPFGIKEVQNWYNKIKAIA